MTDTPTIPKAAIDLYDAYAHRTLDRRGFLADLAKLMGGAAAAAAVLPLIEPATAHAQQVAEDDPRVSAEVAAFEHLGVETRGYLAWPADGNGPYPAVLVIHENRGLNDHIRDVARRLATEGFLAFAPDFLSRSGGTPDDPDRAREMISELPQPAARDDALGALIFLRGHERSTGATGAVGFCWGGAMVNQIAIADPDLDAGVVFYGSSPDSADAVRIQAAMLLHYGGLDDRINEGVPAYQRALEEAGTSFEMHVYEDVNHAFHNDTSEARYDREAAELAWARTIAFFRDQLG
ncbi:dienelactone hydrolase family protein [Glycocaulis profundi]|nr:dienelactone hydrolase family protein [Glycocaulis profundi]